MTHDCKTCAAGEQCPDLIWAARIILGGATPSSMVGWPAAESADGRVADYELRDGEIVVVIASGS